MSSWRRSGASRRDRPGTPVARRAAADVDDADRGFAEDLPDQGRSGHLHDEHPTRSLERTPLDRISLDDGPEEYDAPPASPQRREDREGWPGSGAGRCRLPADPDLEDDDAPEPETPLPPVDHWSGRSWQPHMPSHADESAGAPDQSGDVRVEPARREAAEHGEPPARVRFSAEMAARHEAARHAGMAAAEEEAAVRAVAPSRTSAAPVVEEPPARDGMPTREEAAHSVLWEESQDWREAESLPPPCDDAQEVAGSDPPAGDAARPRSEASRQAGEACGRQEQDAATDRSPAPRCTDETAGAADDPAGTSEEARPEARQTSRETGGDGVRDIWARLQAMEDEPLHKRREKSRPRPRDEDEDDDADEGSREAETDPIPWERLDAYGFLPGLFLTLRQILSRPVEFFSAMPSGRPKGKALVFNLLISEFLLVIDFMWSLFGLRAKLGDPGHADAMGLFASTPSVAFLVALLLVPVALSVGIYLDAWLTYLLLLLFRSARKGFNETFRVLCYSAAPTVLSAVPVAGQILSPVILVWYMALQAIGLKKAHEGAYTQVLAAIFIKWSLYLFLLLAMLQSFAPGR